MGSPKTMPQTSFDTGEAVQLPGAPGGRPGPGFRKGSVAVEQNRCQALSISFIARWDAFALRSGLVKKRHFVAPVRNVDGQLDQLGLREIESAVLLPKLLSSERSEHHYHLRGREHNEQEPDH